MIVKNTIKKLEGVTIINLTNHDIIDKYTGTTIKPDKNWCRGILKQDLVEYVNDIPVFETGIQADQPHLLGLPEPQKNTIFIVSAMASALIIDRDDIYSAGKPTTIGNNVKGCLGFTKRTGLTEMVNNKMLEYMEDLPSDVTVAKLRDILRNEYGQESTI